MVGISVAAEAAIQKLLVEWWAAVNSQLEAVTGNTVRLGDAPVATLYESEIGRILVCISAAAEGSLEWNAETAASILADCDAFEAWLNKTPITLDTPEPFWSTPIGYRVLCARLWAERDELITLSEAAVRLNLAPSSLSGRIARGSLTTYWDPFEPNPRHARRIRRSELAKLEHEQRRQPQALAGLRNGLRQNGRNPQTNP